MIATVAALLACGPAGAVAAAPQPPSFLHILTDDQTVDSLAAMPKTKRLLVRRGTRFADYNATQPLCCPSRASFLTGLYPHNHGVLSNRFPYGYAAMDFSRTIYTALDGAGYRTGWIGKVLNAERAAGIDPEPGFDEWLVPVHSEEGADMFDYALSDNGAIRGYADTWQNAILADRARDFIAAAGRNEPFLLTLAVHSPHWSPCPDNIRKRCPPQSAPRDRGTFAGSRYPFGPDFDGGRRARRAANRYWRHELEALRSVDRIVGSLVAELRRRDRLDNTYVIFQSDNGTLHGEHGVFDKNVPWDRSVRVPLVIRGPGFARDARRSDLTANVDVPATILDAAGVRPPLPPDGHSLLGSHRRRILLLERLVGSPRISTDPARHPWLQLKTATGWAYWRDPVSGREHLYDRDRDPYETRNLARRRPQVAARLGRRLARVADCAAPCP
ncbi:MAG TPA: sulfatase-like hydrolase/transferase [Solirubrobacterales bacterium]|nr:sulfatase-like hydrolase/transferase [Solirubrobacterales bacterium]